MADNYLLLYEYVADILERRVPHRESHLEKIRDARAEGKIGLAGALGDPPSGGAFQFTAVGVEEIEAFVAADPYVRAGLVTSWKILPWTLV
jgi:uncharacterized protein YciI